MAESQTTKKKQIILFSLAGLAFIVIVIFGSAKLLGVSKPDAVTGSVVISQSSNSAKVKDVNPAYREQLQEHNKERLEKAEGQGTTVLPVLLPTQTDPQPKQNQPNTPPTQQIRSDGNGNAAQNRQEQTAPMAPLDQAKMESMKMMIAGLTQRPQPSRTLVVAPKEDVVPATSTTGKTSDQTLSAPPVARAGETLFAVLDSYINTDEPDTVHMSITMGPLKGGKLLGTATRLNEVVKVVANTLFFDKKAYDLTAQVMDVDTARGLLTGEVDRKLMQRYGLPFLNGAITGLGAAISQGGTMITSSAVGMTSTTAPLDSRQIAGATIASGAQGVAQQVQAAARNTQPSVLIAAGLPVGVFLLSDAVLKTGSNTKAGAAWESPAQNPPQYQPQTANPALTASTYQPPPAAYPMTQTNVFPTQPATFPAYRANIGVYGQ